MSTTGLLERRVATAFYGQFPALRPHQEASIEPILAGRNVVLCAGTGSGKTEAVTAPLVSRYWRHASDGEIVTILYLSPTKALVNDLERRLYAPLSALGLRIGIRHGDRDDLTSGASPFVLLTTPESLDVMLFRKDANLKTVRAVVIDEVHLLYNTQRGLQLAVLLQRLRRFADQTFQWAALSATLGHLPYVRDFLFGPDEDAVFLQFSSLRKIDVLITHCPDGANLLSLVRRLTAGHAMKLLLFANSRRECEQLAGVLSHDDALRSAVFAHYSSLSPEVRLETERQFARARTAVCLATSTLELGIDIGDIDADLLWGVPGSVESFLQRIGRGNRRSSKANVICIVPDKTPDIVLDALKFSAITSAAIAGELPRRQPHEIYGAVAQQCLDMIAADGGRFTRVADLCTMFSHMPHLPRKAVESILDALVDADYLKRHGFKNRYGAAENLHALVNYRMIYGNFGAGSQTVSVRHGSQVLGEVPAINLLRCRPGECVRFAGKCWQIAKVSRDGVSVRPHGPSAGAMDFAYGGGLPATDPFVVDRMWGVLRNDDFPFTWFAKDLRERLSAFRNGIRSRCPGNAIPYTRSLSGIRYWTFAGYVINRAIALHFDKAGFKADDVSLMVQMPIDWAALPRAAEDFAPIFDRLFEASSEQSLFQTLLPPPMRLREFVQGWLKDETVAAILHRLRSSASVEMPIP